MGSSFRRSGSGWRSHLSFLSFFLSSRHVHKIWHVRLGFVLSQVLCLIAPSASSLLCPLACNGLVQQAHNHKAFQQEEEREKVTENTLQVRLIVNCGRGAEGDFGDHGKGDCNGDCDGNSNGDGDGKDEDDIGAGSTPLT
jgi:hypothetical protein